MLYSLYLRSTYIYIIYMLGTHLAADCGAAAVYKIYILYNNVDLGS